MAAAAAVALAAPPDAPVHLEDSVKLGPDANGQMLDVCRRALPGWAAVAAADVEFSTVSGGISNVNARLAPRAGLGLRPVMFKVFGDKTDQIIDRATEALMVVALGRQGFGPKVLALFANGRIEEWLDCASITPIDMCSERFIPRIARKLRQFHAIEVDLPRTPKAPWAVIDSWLAQAKKLEFTDPKKKAAYAAVDFAALEAEIAEARAACSLTRSPVVFGHNDLLSGNILVLQRPGFDPAAPDMDGPLCFIDYEYGGYTYRGFDVGNHFTEYAGFDGDYSRYPSKEQQALFFQHYLADPSAGPGCPPPPLPPGQLDRLSAEANVWALASHLFWGVWALIQACYSPIDFDYMQFSGTRLGEFRRRKGEFVAEAVRVFGGAGGPLE